MALNYARVEEFGRDGSGKLNSAIIREYFSGETFSIQAKIL